MLAGWLTIVRVRPGRLRLLNERPQSVEHFADVTFAAERRQPFKLHGRFHETGAGSAEDEITGESEDAESCHCEQNRPYGRAGDYASRPGRPGDEQPHRGADPKRGRRPPDERMDIREIKAPIAFTDRAARHREQMIRRQPEPVPLERGTTAARQLSIGATFAGRHW